MKQNENLFGFDDDDDDILDEEVLNTNDVITENDREFAKELYNFFDKLLKDELKEEFVGSNASYYFKRHCLADYENRKSSRDNIFYDFKKVEQYKQYERKITDILKKTTSDSRIYSLVDTEKNIKKFRRLFEGNNAILFASLCEFKNNNGNVLIGLYAFSNYATKNYEAGNTVSVCILTERFNTITMFALDANYLERKINNIIKKYYTGEHKDIA